MSIPANVVLGGDLDTISRLRSGRFDDPFMPSMDRPYGEGLLLVIPPYSRSGSAEYVAPMEMELHRVHFDTNKYTTEDDWSLHINTDIEKNYIIRNYSQKNFTEGIQLMSVIKLKKGDRLTFKLKNTAFGTGIRAEISMAFLVEGENMKGSSTSSPSSSITTGVHISYNLFGGQFGNKINGTELYDEAVPFLVKEGKDYFKLIKMTGTHTDLVPEGKKIKSIIHNLPRTVKLHYEKDNGSTEVLQIKKNYVYVSVPDNVYANATERNNLLRDIEERLEPYSGLKNIPFRVRAIKESNLGRVIKLTVT